MAFERDVTFSQVELEGEVGFPEEDCHNHGGRERGRPHRASEPFRVEGKELAENGPGKVDWLEIPSRGVAIEFLRLWTSHWRVLQWDFSAKDVCAPPLAGGGQPDFCSDFNLMHFNTSVQRRDLHEAGIPQGEIKLK